MTTLSADGGPARNLYTNFFNGTSSASPIVAGAAVLLQNIAQRRLGYRFSPKQLRVILSNPAFNTPSATPATDRIGVMPNLRAIAEGILNIAPDVYIRDYPGDTGDPHTFGNIATSPDIIVLQRKTPRLKPRMVPSA